MRKHIFKAVITIALALYMVAMVNSTAFAEGQRTPRTNGDLGKCTSFYMGKDITKDGSYIWGRCEDFSESDRKLLEVHEAEEHKFGDLFKTNAPQDGNFMWPYPQKTLRYILCKDSAHNSGYTGREPYAEVGINEKGVAITATVTLSTGLAQITGYHNEDYPDYEVSGIDEFVKNGLGEVDTASIILMQATSARGACELLAKIIDKCGAQYCEGTMIGDPNEIWYFQILSGHEYVAVKCPDNLLGFSPNLTGNVDISDKKNVIASPGLVETAKKAGTLKTDDDGNILVANSYTVAPHSGYEYRMWQGYYYLKGKKSANATKSNDYISYFTTPPAGRKYSLYDAMRLLAYRGRGTDYDAAKYTDEFVGYEGWNPWETNLTGIGNSNTQEAHVFETRPNMPLEIATVEWLAMAPPEFSVYLPYYGNLITDVYKKYNYKDQENYNSDDPYDNTMWHMFRELHTQCRGDGSWKSRDRYGAGVQEFWKRYQLSLIEQQRYVDEYMAELCKNGADIAELERIATTLSMRVAEDTYGYAQQMLAELKEFKSSQARGRFKPSALADKNALPCYAPGKTGDV